MRPGVRLPKHLIHQDIQTLVRAFPGEYVTFTRKAIGGVTPRGQVQKVDDVVLYQGEALFIPAGGDVTRYGLGQVEEDKPQMLLVGTYDIRQGDFCLRRGRLYAVQYPPNAWHAFMHITLSNYAQGQPALR